MKTETIHLRTAIEDIDKTKVLDGLSKMLKECETEGYTMEQISIRSTIHRTGVIDLKGKKYSKG